MKILFFLLVCFSCYSQQQVLPFIIDDETPVSSGFAGNFQFLFENNTNEETGNHTPTITGTPSYVASVNVYNGQAISLDGSQYIDLPASADFSTTQFTIAFFVRRAAFQTGFHGILEHDRFGNNWYGVFTASSAGELNVRASNSSPSNTTTSDSWNTSQWYHIIFTYNGTTATVYRDGVSLLSTPLNSGTANLSAIRLFTNLDGGETFTGDIDRFEFWNISKNATELADIYDCALNGNNCNN